MDKELKIKIKVDNQTQELKNINADFTSIDKNAKKSAQTTQSFQNQLSEFKSGAAKVAGVAAAFYTLYEGVKQVATAGVSTNRTMQNLTNSLTTMEAVTSASVDSMGNVLSITERYDLANKAAANTMQELLKINAKTPHTLDQTVKIYDSMYIGMKKVGATSADMVEITEKLSIAVGNKVGFDAMLSAMDGLSTGTVEVASEMGRFLKAIGLSNEEIKASTDVVQLFKDKLADFKAIESFDTKLSNLTNSWNSLTAVATEPMFNKIEDNLAPLATLFDGLTHSIKTNKESFAEYADIMGDLLLTTLTLTAGYKTFNSVQGIYQSVVANSTQVTQAKAKALELDTKAITLGTQATTARKIADEARIVAQKSNLAMAQAQYVLLEKEAVALEASAKKANATALAYQTNTAALQKATIASRALSTAMATIPHVALGIGMFALVDYLTQSNEKMIDLSKSTKDLGEDLSKLTKNQLLYQQSLVETELAQRRLDLANAKADAASQSFFESDKQHKEDLAYLDEMQKKFTEAQKASRALKNAINELDSTKEEKTLVPKFDDSEIQKSISETLNPYQAAIDKITAKWETNFKLMSANGKDTSGIVQAWTQEITALDAQYESQAQTEQDKINESIKRAEEESQKKQQLAEQALKAQQQAYSNFLQITGSDYEKWLDATNQKMIELASSGTLTAEQLQLAFDSMQKEYNVEIKAKVTELEIEQIEQDYSAMEEALDYQMQLIDSADAWGNTLDGVAGDILNIVGAYNKVEKASLNYQKDQLKADEKLALARAKYGEDSIELIKAEQAHQLESTRIKESQQQSEINGYANIAGAYSSMAGSIATMADEGSTAAKVATVAQQALAVASGVASILNQGAGDPYSAFARIAAMTALVVSTLASAGVSFSGGGSVGQGDFSSEVPSWTQTTVLGGQDETSQSINNSLEVLEDFAQPQFGVLSEMRNYLENIDKNLVAVGADVIRTGEFALGVGAKEFQKSWAEDPEIFGKLSDSFFGVTGIYDPLGDLTDSILGAFGLGGGGYTWQQLIGSGISFGSSASAGDSYTASEDHYLQAGELANSLQSTQAQTLDDLIKNIDALLYQTTAREDSKKDFFGSASYSYSSTTAYQAMEQELENSLVKTFESIKGSILSGSDLLNRDIETELGKQLVDISNIDFGAAEDAEELNELLSTAFSEQSDKFIQELYGDTLTPFQAVGEGLYETFTRVSAGIGEADYYINKLGNSFDSVDFEEIADKNSDVAIEALRQSIAQFDEAIYGVDNGVVELLDTVTTSAEDLYNTYEQLDDARLLFDSLSLSLDGLSQSTIIGTDGIDGLTNSLNSVLGLMSETDQMQYIFEKVSKEFENLGLSLPTSTEAYLDLVQGIDTSTEAGQELLGRVLSLSDSFSEFAEILETSENNIKSFADSFRTSQQILAYQASDLGMIVPNTVDDLIKQFEKLANDTAGLTDIELEYLENAKDYLDTKNEELAQAQQDSIQAQIDAQNELLQATQANMSSIESIIKSLDSTVDKFKESMYGSEYVLEQFYESMAKSQTLLSSKDYETLQDELANTIAYSDALFEATNFGSQQDMLRAQTVALNQFEGMDIILEDELDVLKQIEENTKQTVNALGLQLEKLGTSITDSNSELQEWFDKNYPDGGTITTPTGSKELTANEQAVTEAFQSVLGRDPAKGGLGFYANYIEKDPNVTVDNIEQYIARGATTASNGDLYNALDWFKENNILWGQDLLDRSYSEGHIADNEANQLLDKYGMPNKDLSANYDLSYETFKNLFGDYIVPFANGGVVHSPTLALFGEAGSEAFVPLPDGKNIPVTFGGGSLIEEFKKIREENIKMNETLKTMSSRIDDINDRYQMDFNLRYQE